MEEPPEGDDWSAALLLDELPISQGSAAAEREAAQSSDLLGNARGDLPGALPVPGDEMNLAAAGLEGGPPALVGDDGGGDGRMEAASGLLGSLSQETNPPSFPPGHGHIDRTGQGRPSMLQHVGGHFGMLSTRRPQGPNREAGARLQEVARAVLPAAPPATTGQLLQQCRPDVSQSHTWVPRLFQGYCLPSPLPRALDACSQLSRRKGQRTDEDIHTAVDILLGPAPLEMATKKLRASTLGIPPAKLDNLMPMLGSAVVVMDKAARAEWEKAVVGAVPSRGLVLYLDFCAYDETPLTVITRGRGNAAPSREGQLVLIPDARDTSPQQPLFDLGPSSALAPLLHSSKGPQKILQTVQAGGMLVKVGDVFISFFCSAVPPLQALSAGTAVCLKEAQVRGSSASRAASLFSQATRVVCTDRYAANTMAEKSLSDDRGAPWSHLHLHCDIHRTASAHTKTFCLMESNIRGMIHTSLALGNGAAMEKFRSCLRDEVGSRFEVLHGRPTTEANMYRKSMINLFVSHGSRVPLRRLLLIMCPNGDWRSPRVQFYPAAGSARQPTSAYLEHVVAGLMTALCAAQPSTYPRHRWTGADLATDALGVMEACHQLLSTTFARFAASFQHGPTARQVMEMMAEAHEAPPQPGPAARADAQSAGGGALLGANEEAGDVLVQLADPSSGAGLMEQGWAAVNATHRRVAMEWLSSKPLRFLTLQRIIMEPLRQLLAHQFHVAGAAFEAEQQMRVASKLALGGGCKFSDRDYRASLAAKGVGEKKCLGQLQSLFTSPEVWTIFPRSAYAVHFRALAFRMLARCCCCIQQLLGFPHQQFPCRMFALLAEPGLAGEFVATPSCLLDPWSAELRQRHPDLGGAELMQKLALIGTLAWTDISQVESRHATVRRIMKQGSLQTKQQMFASLSAEWCLLQYRKRRQRANKSNGAIVTATRKATLFPLGGVAGVSGQGQTGLNGARYGISESALCIACGEPFLPGLCFSPTRQVIKKTPKRRGRRGFGGPYRAFVRAESRGKVGRPDLKQLASIYNQRLADGTLDKNLFDVGRAATIAGRFFPPKAGRSAFGATGRDDKRKRQKDLRHAILAVAAGADKEQASMALCDSLVKRGADIASCLTAARAALRLQTKRAKAQADLVDKALVAFRHGPGAAALSTLQQLVPALPQHSRLLPVPTPDGLAFDLPSADAETIAGALSWCYPSRQTNVSHCLREHWSQTHETIMDSDSAPIHTAPPTEGMCYKAGRCLCSAEGGRLRNLRDAVIRSMKTTFPFGTDLRQTLVNGHVILRLVGRPAEDNYDAWVDEDNPVKTIFLHVGLLYLSPFRPTWMHVLEVTAPVGEEFGPNTIWVEAPQMGPKLSFGPKDPSCLSLQQCIAQIREDNLPCTFKVRGQRMFVSWPNARQSDPSGPRKPGIRLGDAGYGARVDGVRRV